jgi:hypothetical protein
MLQSFASAARVLHSPCKGVLACLTHAAGSKMTAPDLEAEEDTVYPSGSEFMAVLAERLCACLWHKRTRI